MSALHQHVADVAQRAAVEVDLAAEGLPTQHRRLDEHLAPQEGVDLEAVARVVNRGRHHGGARQPAVTVVPGLESAPEARHEAEGAVGLRHQRTELGHVHAPHVRHRLRRRHHPVDVAVLARSRVVVEHREAARERRHVRFDDGLGDARGHHAVAGVAAQGEHVGGSGGGERVGADGDPVRTPNRLLGTEARRRHQSPSLLVVRRRPTAGGDGRRFAVLRSRAAAHRQCSPAGGRGQERSPVKGQIRSVNESSSHRHLPHSDPQEVTPLQEPAPRNDTRETLRRRLLERIGWARMPRRSRGIVGLP